jgi:endogenous inhibitor of DNA gyrase (YacG/DUF329 family)
MTEEAPQRRCPVCGKPAVPEETPFCSTRCANVDLHRWLSGSYAIPVPPDADDEEADPVSSDGS